MPKILVVNPDSSKFGQIITKVNTLNQKSGPFDALFLLGNVFNGDETINQESKLEIPTYYTKGSESTDCKELHSVIKSNLTYLGDYGVFTSTDGIKIGFIHGDEDSLDKNRNQMLSLFQGKQVDVLLSYQWSKVIADERSLFLGHSIIDEILEIVEPKYHFAAGSKSGKFYERAPFQWDDGRLTRFISLGQFGGSEKWVYAFNLNLDSEGDLPKNLTPNPFKEAHEKRLKEQSITQETQKRRLSNADSSQIVKKPQRLVVSPENCFFCLSNPQVKSHMIISIGEHVYLTIAKGPLTRPTDKMNFSGHCLIVPIEHIPNIQPTHENDSVVKTPLFNEILRYQASLVKLFASFDLGTVFFQINKSEAVHFHIQSFPVPQEFLIDFERTLEKNKSLNNVKFRRSTKLDFQKFDDSTNEEYLEILNSKRDYISFQVFNKTIQSQTIYISYLEEGKALDLQFGRRVLAYLLQTPKRIKWDVCQQSEEIETMETETFKDNYQPYDFTVSV